MKIKGFITHKLAEEYQDCQDFFAVNEAKKILAISDGMSQSIFPQWWAELLVRFYIDKGGLNEKDLEECRTKWMKQVQDFLNEKREKLEPTWMLENCLAEKRGAGATFCGIQFDNHNWSGQVLGDSCLIEVSGENQIEKIHRSQDSAFNNHPDYFDSIQGGKGEAKPINGTLKENGKLLLVTDPFAEFLHAKWQEKQESDYIEQLRSLDSHEDFCKLVDDWREKGMNNDDSTLVIIEHDGCEDFKLKHVDDIEELCKKKSSLSTSELADTPLPNNQDEIISLIEELRSNIEKIIKTLANEKRNKRKIYYSIKKLIHDKLNLLIQKLKND